MDDQLQQVKEAARAVFRTPQAVNAWLTLPCPRLGGTPLKLIEAGQADRVLALLNELPPDPGASGFLASLFTFRRR